MVMVTGGTLTVPVGATDSAARPANHALGRRASCDVQIHTAMHLHTRQTPKGLAHSGNPLNERVHHDVCLQAHVGFVP